jgi:hypothetical protein
MHPLAGLQLKDAAAIDVNGCSRIYPPGVAAIVSGGRGEVWTPQTVTFNTSIKRLGG